VAFESVANLGSDRQNVKLDDSIPQICQVLRRLQEQRALLTVQIGTAAASYTSAILEVVREEKYLVLDELIPREGHLQLQQTKQLQVRGILDGIEVRFTSNVTQVSTQNGLPFYKVPFPSQLDFPQRRQVHRVPIPLNTGLPVTLLMPDERLVSGELRDISPEGLGIRVRTGAIDIQRDQDIVVICQLAFKGEPEFVADIQLCHIDPPVRGRVPRVGARFVDLQPPQARRIEQFCAELAREQRRVR
jgi:c-di-GMP-binding flagellar brake protein YcgR